MLPALVRHCGILITAIFLLSADSSNALAHGGNPAQAPFTEPSCACLTFDEAVPFVWLDSDSPTAFGPATIDFFAIQQSPATFDRGIDPMLGGIEVVRGVLEPDTNNRAVWNTSTVASGHYLLWSRVNEPPEEMSPLYVEISPHVITVRHNEEPVGPSVVITKPANSFSVSIGTFELRYSACDPTGNARVRLEAGLGGRFELLADDLPAVIDGRFSWDTRYVPEGDWTLRATVSDGCGGKYYSYGRFYLQVIPPLDPVPDAGPRDVQASPPLDARSGESCAESWPRMTCDLPDAAVRDLGFFDAAVNDSGGVVAPAESCDCRASGARGNYLALLIIVSALRMRRDRPAVRR